jgi:xanthine/uracil permease
MGTVMGGVSWVAFRMVRHAGVKLLGFVPLTSIHPADGLWLFFAASLMVMVLGFVEIAVSQERRRRRTRVHARADARPS